ncbi:DUF294 nucleotidyltransferase-like domain-containing protein [Microaerobacter geothermalis]|uniref:DUF294 nucleotidyltransferase-like domain-containing protein n=1 Tax=Microaerobacter geothermalis TaxID=674972 RepID=UPI001F38CAEB|nr:DUF294 nucleotidyltransferase-like domain-containing protein [Microaerobacter geothermalis]MCF6093964.1 DUF294 nucleotidyltransferase-like domain-containing protein [Microaerobacter geothermalis]
MERLFQNWQKEIAAAFDLKELKQIHWDISKGLSSGFSKGLIHLSNVIVIYDQLTKLHDQMMIKTFQLVEQGLQQQGKEAPVPFCWLILGSGGRKEQTLWTDQDHALVYLNPPEEREKEIDDYFQSLADQLVLALDDIGYPLCKGNVMISNPRWRNSAVKWKNTWTDWVEHHHLDHLRFALISADFRPIYGLMDLGKELRHWFSTFISKQQAFLSRGAEHNLVHQIPVGPLGQFITERYGEKAGYFNLKEGIYRQMVETLRLWSMKYEIPAVNSFERLSGLSERGLWKVEEIKEWEQALAIVFFLRLFHHVTSAAKLEFPDNFIQLQTLEKEQMKELKKAMKLVRRFQKYTNKKFTSM